MATLSLAIIGDDVLLDIVSAALTGRGRQALRLRGDVDPLSAKHPAYGPQLWVVGTRVGAADGETWLRDARARGLHTPSVLLRSAERSRLPLPPRLGVTRPVDASAGAGVILAAVSAVAATFTPPSGPLVLPPEEVAAEVARLSKEYGRELPDKVASMQTALALATQDGVDSATSRAGLAATRDIAHRLRGTAGSFGYSAFGNQIEVLEQLLRQHLDAGVPLDLERVRETLEGAAALVDTIAPGG